jgi:hypothetical protein
MARFIVASAASDRGSWFTDVLHATVELRPSPPEESQ